MTNELLEKVIRTTEIGSAGSGILNVKQSDQFLDYMWDATVLGSQVRKRRMRNPIEDIDKINVGQRVLKAATEAVDTGVNAGATFSKISLRTEKLRLDWELSTESLEDNIEGEALEDHLARMMATAAGNDLEDLAINGDTASSDPLLAVFDGYSKLLRGAGGHVIDANGGVLDRGVINAAIKALPRKYRTNRGGFKFFTGSGPIQDYIYSLQAVEAGLVNPEVLAAAGINQAVSPQGAAGFVAGNAFGFQIQEIPLIREDKKLNEGSGSAGTGDANNSEMWLTDPKNFLWGVKRDIEIHREFKPKKDTIEYTLYLRVGVQVEHTDASVVVKNLGPGPSTI